MKITLYTLIDIEDTGQRKGPNATLIGQQTNYDTVVQVLGLRANPEPINFVKHNSSIDDIGFGKQFVGEHSYIEFTVNMPDGSTDLDILQNDFNLVPVIKGLTETVDLDIGVFNTMDADQCNIIFKCAD